MTKHDAFVHACVALAARLEARAAGRAATIRRQAAEIERLRKHAEAKYQRGIEEGRACQAMLEVQGRDRFVKELKAQLAADAAKGVKHEQ